MGTLNTKSEVYQDIEQAFGTVPVWAKQLPETALPGFWSVMRDFQLAETRIPNKYKELIGLAVSGATRCRYCALFHTGTVTATLAENTPATWSSATGYKT